MSSKTITFCVFLLLIGFGVISYSKYASSAESTEIVIPDQSPSDEAAIQKLVSLYYQALREENFQFAAQCYEKDAFNGLGIDPQQALRSACKLMSVPETVKVDAIRITGESATGEVILDDNGDSQGLSYYELRDENGKRLGTWARTLNFVKQDGFWRISADSTQSVGGVNERQTALLKKLLEVHRKQQESK